MNEQNKKVPTVRFKGFTNDWEQRKLEDISNIYDGTHQTPNYQNQGIMFLSVENIETLHSNKFISKEEYNERFKIKPSYHDILMTRIGSIGKTNVIETHDPIAYYVSLALLKPSNPARPYFLKFLLEAENAQKELRRRTLQIAFPQKINKDEIGKIKIELPNTDEQKKIDNLLRMLSSLISLQQRKLDLLKQLKKGLLQKMFADKGSKRPILRFEGFSNDWEQRKLKDIKDVRDGTHSSPKYQEEGYPLITSKNLATNGIDLSDVSFISKHDYQEINKRSKVENGDILFGMIGTIGNPVIVKKDGFAIKNVALIKYGGELLNYFLLYLLKSPIFLQYINRENAGGTQKFLALSVIRNFKFRVPSKAEQENIAHVLNSLTRLITLQQRKITKYNEIKKSLLQQMFI